jgi:hypothetical protein
MLFWPDYTGRNPNYSVVWIWKSGISIKKQVAYAIHHNKAKIENNWQTSLIIPECDVSQIVKIYKNKQLITMKTTSTDIVFHADAATHNHNNEKWKMWTLSVP